MGKTCVVVWCVVVVVVAWCGRVGKAWRHECNKETVSYYGCSTYNLITQQQNTKCLFWSSKSPNFSFYFQPGPHFSFLQIVVAKFLGSGNIEVRRSVLRDPKKWYHIEFTEKNIFYTKHEYHLSIDGQMKNKITFPFNKGTKFDVYARGFSSYAPLCNPDHYTPQPTLPPRFHPPILRPSPSPTTTIIPTTTTQLSIFLVPPRKPSSSMNTKENDSSTVTWMDHSGKIPASDTTESPASLPWYILVIVGVAGVALVTILLATTILVIRKKNLVKMSDSTGGAVNKTFNSQEITKGFPSTQEDEDTEHIYEEVDDLGPLQCVRGGWGPGGDLGEGVGGNMRRNCGGNIGWAVGVNMEGGYTDWVDRRGSAHESENSLYVPFNSIVK